MDNNQRNSLQVFLEKRQGKDTKILLALILTRIENSTGKSLNTLKKQFSEEALFQLGLEYVTTTKKAICKALDIPIEAGCRYKRQLEKNGHLVQSINEFICPITKHKAHLLSTNQTEFESLLKSNSIQLNIFDHGQK